MPINTLVKHTPATTYSTEEFTEWLYRLLKDSKQKLNMSDRTIAYILLREGTNFYLKDICNDELRAAKEHNRTE